MVKNNGCAYGKVTRQMVIDLKEAVETGFERIDNGLREIRKENQILYNHLSNRSLPSDLKIIKILIAIVSASLGFAFSLLIKLI